jgi:hypothetical protein
MALWTCRVTCNDLNGIEHMVEVTAHSLYEAVAHGISECPKTLIGPAI